MSHFTTVSDLDKNEIQHVLDLSLELDQNRKDSTQVLADKNVLFCFEKPSLRTLVGTESAINQLGGSVIHTTPEAFLGGNVMYAKNQATFGERESLKDTVKNIEHFCDGIFARVFAHETIEQLAHLSDIPVVNALCNLHHPMQALADLLTLQELFGKKETLSVTFIGDGNNVAFSLGEILLTFGHNFVWSGPDDYPFSNNQVGQLEDLATKHGGTFSVISNPHDAVQNAHAIYTDTFVSMGEEDQHATKIEAFSNFQVNEDLMKSAPKASKFMHCLPAHRGVEVTDKVIDGSSSIVYHQAKNRMVTSKGLFTYLLTH